MDDASQQNVDTLEPARCALIALTWQPIQCALQPPAATHHPIHDPPMPNFKVTMVSWNDPAPAWVGQRLAEHGIDLTTRECFSGEDVLGCAADADVIWVNSGSRCLTAEEIRSLPRCRVILRSGAGTDNIPVEFATQEGIVVAHTPHAVMGPVAEHAIALLLAVVRRIPHQHRLVHEGHWDQFGKLGGPAWPMLEQATPGLIGFGRIARIVAKKPSGFEMRVIASDPLLGAPLEVPIQSITTKRNQSRIAA